MNNKIINRYIEFGIENGYKRYIWCEIKEEVIKKRKRGVVTSKTKTSIFLISNSDWDWDIGHYMKEHELLSIITSKEFIEAIHKWIIWKWNEWWNELQFDRLIDCLTYKQAIAIRDGKLEEFIEGLLDNK